MMEREGETVLPMYHCHKTVRAAPIVAVDVMLAQLTIELPDGTREMRYGRPGMFAERVPEAGDYFVEYEGGYRSVSPRLAFLAGYRPLPPVALVVDVTRFTPDELDRLGIEWDQFCHRAPLLARDTEPEALD